MEPGNGTPRATVQGGPGGEVSGFEMRSFVPAYELRTPSTLEDALALLADAPGRWRPFAGGTDLMVLLEAGRLPHTHYVSLWGIEALRFIDVTEERVAIGALTTYTDVLEHATLRREFPLVCDAAAETGGVANQNRGTLAGNIANASPAADTPPALLVYDAELELASLRGRRRVRYDAFHRGYKAMDLEADEIILAIHLPRGRRWTREFYRKVGTRRAQAISKVCLAAALAAENAIVRDVRIAVGSVAPTVLRARETEAILTGRRLEPATMRAARDALASEIAPIDDLRSSADYRRAVACNLLEAFLSG